MEYEVGRVEEGNHGDAIDGQGVELGDGWRGQGDERQAVQGSGGGVEHGTTKHGTCKPPFRVEDGAGAGTEDVDVAWGVAVCAGDAVSADVEGESCIHFRPELIYIVYNQGSTGRDDFQTAVEVVGGVSEGSQNIITSP